jgi:HPt (histidine-containing phosphotransfer) domain-containing protein
MGSTPVAGKSGHDCGRGLADREDRPTGDPIDLAYLARFTLGNSALEREVLQLFAEQTPLYLAALREARLRKAWREAAHSIKGSASAVGAWRLARSAEMAERVDVEGQLASRGRREEALVVVAGAAEEACRFIAGVLARG